jgi:alkylhydroperoxidase family enzyme
MARLPLLSAHDPDTPALVANHPEALQAMVEFGTVVYFQNSMTAAQREVAYLTASVTNDCHY